MSFTYIPSAADWARIAPLVVLAVVSLLVLIVDLLISQSAKNQKSSSTFLVLPLLSLLGLAGAILATIILFVLRSRSFQESGMKYFLLSSFASAFLLYGIAMTYGATGNTSFIGIHTFLFNNFPTARSVNPAIIGQLPSFLLIGMGLLIVGFAFKVSAIPFQA